MMILFSVSQAVKILSLIVILLFGLLNVHISEGKHFFSFFSSEIAQSYTMLKKKISYKQDFGSVMK